MFKKYKGYLYAAAILVGIVGVALGALSSLKIGIVYFLLGLIFGYVWPKEGWRWGLYLSSLIVGIMALSILFAGLGGDIKGDMFFISAILGGSVIGSLAGSFIRKKLNPLH